MLNHLLSSDCCTGAVFNGLMTNFILDSPPRNARRGHESPSGPSDPGLGERSPGGAGGSTDCTVAFTEPTMLCQCTSLALPHIGWHRRPGAAHSDWPWAATSESAGPGYLRPSRRAWAPVTVRGPVPIVTVPRPTPLTRDGAEPAGAGLGPDSESDLD